MSLSYLTEEAQGFLCMFWNVENFFEKSPHFYDKCNGISKTIFLAADEFGSAPDIIGLAEVENASVVRKLVNYTNLRRLSYNIIHYDSPDHRGIDCAMLYRRTRFREVFSKACHIRDSSGRILPTRDILLAVLEPIMRLEGIPPSGVRPSGSPHHPFGTVPPLPCRGWHVLQGEYLPAYSEPEELHAAPVAILVNHHPSKVGNSSGDRRALAMARLLELRDSLLAVGITRIVAVGDFNEEVTSAQGVEAAWPAGSGTIKFQGRWEKIDGCPVLEGLEAREHIFAPPFLSTRDSASPGLKPLRTFSGPRYLGGLSDHYPIILEIRPLSRQFLCEIPSKQEQSAAPIQKFTKFERCKIAETKTTIQCQ